jgi:hypothetical protein
MLISKITNSRALDTPTPSHSFGESTSGNAIYQASVRLDGTDPPAQRLTPRALHAPPTPRASRHVLLLPRVTCTSHRLRLAPPAQTRAAHSRDLTSTSWHRAPCRHQPPRQRASIVGQHVDEHMLQPYVSCILNMFHLNVAKVYLVLHMLQ